MPKHQTANAITLDGVEFHSSVRDRDVKFAYAGPGGRRATIMGCHSQTLTAVAA
jgi:hypothetical protein